MPGLTDKALKRLNKDYLFAIILEQQYKDNKSIEKMENLTNEESKLNENLQKLESDVVIPKNVNSFQNEGIVIVEWQFWLYTLYPPRENIKIVEIPRSVKRYYLQHF